MWRATLKSLLARKLRLALTALAIVLGVGFMAGTLVLTDTATSAFDDLLGQGYAGTDVVVQASAAFAPGPAGGGGGGGEERNPIPQAVLDDVRAVPGVASAEGDVAGYAQLIDPVTDETIQNGGAPTIGNSWDPSTGSLVFRSGQPPVGPDQVAVDAATAAEHHLAVGQEVRVITQAGTTSFTISGTVGQGDSDSFFGATLTLFDVQTAQRLFDRVGTYDHIYVVAQDGVAATQLRNDIAVVLPDGFEAISAQDAADEAAQQVQEGLGFVRTGLLVFAFVSVFVGAFIIFNTFNILVTQRTRELGLLRALGASGRQVMGSVLVEAAAVGLIGSLLGLGLGLLLAVGLKKLLALTGLELPPTALKVTGVTIGASLLVGTLITMVASFFPARRAAKVSPIQALREGGGSTRPLRRRVALGSVVLFLGMVALAAGLFGGVANAASVVGLGAALTFIGVAAISPLFARPIAAWIGAPMRRMGIAGRLGRENAMRNPRRTASTAAALMIGLGLVAFVTVFASSLKASASAALDRTLRADFVLSANGFAPFSPQMATQLMSLPDLSAVSEFRQGESRVDGATTFVSGVDPATVSQVTDVPIDVGDLADLAQPDAIAVYHPVAQTKGLQIGDELGVEFARTGDQDFRVVAIYSESGILGDYAISLDAYERNFAQNLDMFAFVKVAEGTATDQARTEVEQVLEDYPNVQLRDQSEFKAEQSKAIDQVLGFVLVLLLLSVVIAVFGIVNTLSLSIYERIRELGLLRAVGMSRRQVRRMVRSEAVIVAILGAVLGMVIGLFFGWALQRALVELGVDRLRVPLGQLLIYLVVAALCGVVAAVWPARRAARLDVLQAIAYE